VVLANAHVKSPNGAAEVFVLTGPERPKSVSELLQFVGGQDGQLRQRRVFNSQHYQKDLTSPDLTHQAATASDALGYDRQ
jgi:hypothetical protein